eukprot:6927860-Heterocapsa_arctica.AAC.1
MEFAPGWSLGDVGVVLVGVDLVFRPRSPVGSPQSWVFSFTRMWSRSVGVRVTTPGWSRSVEPVCYGDVGVDSP